MSDGERISMAPAMDRERWLQQNRRVKEEQEEALAPDYEVNAEARRAGLPVVDREVVWDGADGYYHHYPTVEQVRSWIAAACFEVVEEAAGSWHEVGYAYHHLLARVAASAQVPPRVVPTCA